MSAQKSPVLEAATSLLRGRRVVGVNIQKHVISSLKAPASVKISYRIACCRFKIWDLHLAAASVTHSMSHSHRCSLKANMWKEIRMSLYYNVYLGSVIVLM